MTQDTQIAQRWALASVALRDAFTDFILSRRAIRCTDRTIQNYEYTLGRFLTWLEGQNISRPEEITARHVRAYLAEFSGHSGYYQHGIARCIKTMLRFFHAESYMPVQVRFDMPKIPKKKLRVLNIPELRQLLALCTTEQRLRDVALI